MFSSTPVVKPQTIENIKDRKIGLEKFNSKPFFGNEQQAFSLKKTETPNAQKESTQKATTTLAAAPQTYNGQTDAQIKQKHMSDKELKAKIEVQPTR